MILASKPLNSMYVRSLPSYASGLLSARFPNTQPVLYLCHAVYPVPPLWGQKPSLLFFLQCPLLSPSSNQHNTWYTGGDINYMWTECPPLFLEFKSYPSFRSYLSAINYPNRKHFPFIFTLTDLLLISGYSPQPESHSFLPNDLLFYICYYFICLVLSCPLAYGLLKCRTYILILTCPSPLNSELSVYI